MALREEGLRVSVGVAESLDRSVALGPKVVDVKSGGCGHVRWRLAPPRDFQRPEPGWAGRANPPVVPPRHPDNRRSAPQVAMRIQRSRAGDLYQAIPGNMPPWASAAPCTDKPPPDPRG